MINAVIYLCLLMIVTSFVTVELRNLSAAVRTYQIQSVLIASIFALYAYTLSNASLYLWSATALVSKGIIIPWLLYHYVLKTRSEEITPILNILLSQVLGLVAALSAFWWVYACHDRFIILAGLAGEPYRMNLAVAAAVLVIGFYALLTRRDGIKIVIGLCLLENGVHMSLVSLAPSISETALIGIVTDVVITVWMLLYIIDGVYKSSGSTDTFDLANLRG